MAAAIGGLLGGLEREADSRGKRTCHCCNSGKNTCSSHVAAMDALTRGLARSHAEVLRSTYRACPYVRLLMPGSSISSSMPAE